MEEKTRICNKMVIFRCIIVDYISSFTQSKLVKNGTPRWDMPERGRWHADSAAGDWICLPQKNTADANASAVWQSVKEP